MNESMHDLLAAAIDGRTHAFAEGSEFADGHRGRVLRSIRARRAATYAGTGTVAAAVVVSAGFGVNALGRDPLSVFPGGQPSPDPSIPIPSISPGAPSLATPVLRTLVPVEIDASIYPAGEASRVYVFYASLGATDTIPFPASGIWYPGIPDVPADALIIAVPGDAEGYDLEAPDAPLAGIQALPAWTDLYDMVGNRDAGAPQRAAAGLDALTNWDVIGEVTDHTRWGVHYFMLDGNIVTEAEGRANPNAFEVTAWYDPSPPAESSAVPGSSVTTTLVHVPLADRYSTDGTTSRTYAYYASTGSKNMISFPGGGLWYPGIPDVPADAVVLTFAGGVDGFDFANDVWAGDMGIMPAWLNETNLYDYDLMGDRCNICNFEYTADGQNASIAFDVIGEITDHTSWGIHYYLVDGEVVREIDGRANPDAIEVTAWFDPASFTPTP